MRLAWPAPATTASRRLVAILSADAAGYSRLMGVDEEGTLAALKALRRELTDPKLKQHHGRISQISVSRASRTLLDRCGFTACS